MEGNKRKIFIVDDDGFLLDMYAFKFSQNAFEVYTFTEGTQALEKLRTLFIPDVILMDITMPVMDGFEVLEKINAENLAPNAVKIILSNKSQPADIERGRGLGVAGYVIKANSTPAEVIEEVIKILDNKGAVMPKE
jgi:CheY-like chemotaxis protein